MFLKVSRAIVVIIDKVLPTFKQEAGSHARSEVIKPNNLLFSFLQHVQQRVRFI